VAKTAQRGLFQEAILTALSVVPVLRAWAWSDDAPERFDKKSTSEAVDPNQGHESGPQQIDGACVQILCRDEVRVQGSQAVVLNAWIYIIRTQPA